MNRRFPRASRAWLLCGLAAIVPAAFAQSAFYLRPERFSATVGDQLRVNVARVDRAAMRTADWPSDIEWMFVRSLGAQSNLDNPHPSGATENFLRITLSDPGVTVIGLDETPRVESFPAEQFRAFVRDRVASGAELLSKARLRGDQAGNQQTVRVRMIASGKAMVRVSQSPRLHPALSAIAQSKTGQRVELRAMADPTMVPVGSDLPLRAYARGDKVAGALVRATNEQSSAVINSTTDRSGICNFHITSAGVWRIEFFDLTPSPKPDADWVLYSASLIFETPEPGDAK